MSIDLNNRQKQFIDDQLKAGRYDSPEEVISAGLATLEQLDRLKDFAPGELEQLLAEGESDIERGAVYDGDAVFRELDAISSARRREKKR